MMLNFPSQRWMAQALNARVVLGAVGFLTWVNYKKWYM